MNKRESIELKFGRVLRKYRIYFTLSVLLCVSYRILICLHKVSRGGSSTILQFIGWMFCFAFLFTTSSVYAYYSYCVRLWKKGYSFADVLSSNKEIESYLQYKNANPIISFIVWDQRASNNIVELYYVKGKKNQYLLPVGANREV